MSQILSGLDTVLCHIDDVLIYGSTTEEHDTYLRAVLSRLQKAGVTLNADKCLFSQTSIHFLGHVTDKNGVGVYPDPERITAVRKMEAPKDLTQLRRFMGMVNQLSKFTPNLSTLSQPLTCFVCDRSKQYAPNITAARVCQSSGRWSGRPIVCGMSVH